MTRNIAARSCSYTKRASELAAYGANQVIGKIVEFCAFQSESLAHDRR